MSLEGEKTEKEPSSLVVIPVMYSWDNLSSNNTLAKGIGSLDNLSTTTPLISKTFGWPYKLKILRRKKIKILDLFNNWSVYALDKFYLK